MASFQAFLHILQTRFNRKIQAFHGLSFSFRVVYSLLVIYYKIYRGCAYCFVSASCEHSNDGLDEKLIVLALSFQMFLVPHHFCRRHTRLKGVLHLLFDSLSILDMTKSLLNEKGASPLIFMMFFCGLSDPILSLMCMLNSTSADTVARGRRHLLESIYIVLFALTNVGVLILLLFLGTGGEYRPPLLMTAAFIFKTISSSIATQFLAVTLKRRYTAAISSFFRQLFVRVVMTEIDYYEN